jgi:hypothetical protein
VGKVVHRGGPRAAVLVEWENGRQQKIKSNDPTVRYADTGTRRLEWLQDRQELHRQFEADPSSVFVDVIKDEGTTIRTHQIKRRIIDLGVDAGMVEEAFLSAKALLRKNPHIVVDGSAHSWSETSVDPLTSLRSLSPHEALSRLVKSSRLAAEKKDALADAILRALPAR